MCKGMSKEEAMQGYIDEIKKIIETMPQSEHTEELLRNIGPFYEYVNEEDLDDDNNIKTIHQNGQADSSESLNSINNQLVNGDHDFIKINNSKNSFIDLSSNEKESGNFKTTKLIKKGR
jgi:hypothetical protein